MKYCSNCGKLISDDANYCSYCGASATTALSAQSTVIEPADMNYGYRVILYSKGTCTAKTAREVLADLLGYTLNTAQDLLDCMPVEIADELTQIQAVTIGQALAEYGMDVAIVDENNTFIDFSDKVTSSVYASDGALMAAALSVLATLTAANRVHSYRKYRKPSLLSLIFRPKYIKPTTKPVHVRRNVNPKPEPSRRIAVQPAPSMKKGNFRQPSMHQEPKQKSKTSPADRISGNNRGVSKGHRPQ